jgi:hypothetical protein
MDLSGPAWQLLPIVLLGRVLINAQIAAGYAFTLRLRHGDEFLRLLYGCPKNGTHSYRRSGAQSSVRATAVVAGWRS